MNTISSSLTNRASILANRQGTLTDQQHDLLRLTSGLTFWYALGSAIVITGIVTWAMTLQMANRPANAPRVPAYFWIVLAVEDHPVHRGRSTGFAASEPPSGLKNRRRAGTRDSPPRPAGSGQRAAESSGSVGGGATAAVASNVSRRPVHS